MKTNKIILCIFTSSLLFAQTENQNTNISNNIIQSASEGREVVSEAKLDPVNINKLNKEIYRSETILNWYYYFIKLNPRGQEATGKTSENLLVKNLVPNKEEPTNKTDDKKELVAVKGFCFITNEINVGKQTPASLSAMCQTNVGAINMFANLVNVNEKASLVADPKFIEKNGVRYIVESAIVTNEEKTSYNIATFVNDRKLSEVGWGALSVSSDELKTASNEYLRALEDSKKKQSVEYATVTDGADNSYMQPVQTTNTEKPDPLDYLVKSAINITASAVKSTADIFKKDLPYLYQILPKTKIWIDLKVNKKGEYVK